MGQSLPVFWVGIMLILLFAVQFRLLPTSGIGSWRHLIMPAFTLGWYFTAAQTRLTRSAMLDVLDTEYIKLARIKGVPESLVIIKHAFKNAVLPIITMAALNFIVLLNGTVITETIFAWPGVGRLVVQAIFARDYPLVQTCVFISSSLFIFTNLFVDILYMYLDPRIRYK
jgi:peptide/nickel transport system permease protein